MQPTQAVPAPVPAMQVQTQALAPFLRSRYSRGVKILGILQIVMTFLSVILGVAAIVVGSAFNIGASPIWASLLVSLSFPLV